MPNPVPMGPCPVCNDVAPANMTCPYNPPHSCGGPAANCPWCAVGNPIAYSLEVRTAALQSITDYVKSLEAELKALRKHVKHAP